MTLPMPETMAEVRAAIDSLDRELVSLLGQRLAMIRRASELKTHPDEARVPWRIEDVVHKVRTTATHHGFDADLAEMIWRDMMDHCIRFEAERLALRQP
jgi:isochorismate pyruvate lyase